MTNLEVQTLTGLIQRSHQLVYGLASQGRRSEDAYRQNLELLSESVARGSQMMLVARQEISGSTARVGERPPRGVEVDTWREFVRQFTAARTTWFSETNAGQYVAPVQGERAMSYRQLSVDEVRTLNSTLTARVYAVTSQARVSQSSPAFTAALTRLREGLALADARINNYRQEGRGRRLSDAELIGTPPEGVPANMWRGGSGLLGVRTAAQQAYDAGMRGSLSTSTPARSTGAAPARQPAAGQAPTAPIPQKAEPTAEQRRQQPRRASGGATSGGGEPDINIEVPSIEGAAAAITHVGGEALDTARGTFSALRTVGTLITGAPADILGGGITTPLRVLDRLQAIMTVMNPPSVSIYQRPWFWPAILGIGGYVGYSYYKSSQQKASEQKAPAKKTALERAPTLPAPAAR